MSNVFEKLVGPMSIGMLLKAHRTANDLTVAELENKLKLTKGALSKIESGKKKLTLKEAIKFAKKLNEYEDFFALVWFQEEARDAGLDFLKITSQEIKLTKAAKK